MVMDTSMLRGTVANNLRQEGYVKGEHEGYVKGVESAVRALLRLLEFRKVEVTEADRERITSCTDPVVLEGWFDRAFTAERAEELFAEG
jgi:hypothetical protein